MVPIHTKRNTITSVALFLLWIPACNHHDHSSEPLPSSPNPPYSYPLNTQEGYVIHPVFHDTIPKLLWPGGDTVKTGKPYHINGKVMDREGLALPKSVRAGKPIIKPAYTNFHPVPENGEEIFVDESRLTTYEPGKDSSSFVLANIHGDTIPTGIPVPVSGKIKPFSAPQIVAAREASRRYDAVANIQSIDVDQGLNFSNVTSLFKDHQGHLWIGMNLGGVSRYDGFFFSVYSTRSGLINNLVTAIHEDRNGNLWFAASGGISRFDGTSFVNFTLEEGLSTNNISSILEDRKGNIWFGTQGKGVFCFKPSQDKFSGTITHYGPKEGLNVIYVHSMLEDQKGNLWFGTEVSGAVRFELSGDGSKGHSTYFTTKDGMAGNQVLDILEDKNGNIWFGTNGGVCRYTIPRAAMPGRFTHYNFSKDKPNPAVRSIYEDKTGHIWLGTVGSGVIRLIQKGVEGYPNDMYSQFTIKEGLTHNTITSILENENGDMWFGTAGGGICCLRSRMFMHYSQQEGFTQSEVNAIFEDRDGDLWFGTQGDGVIVYHQNPADGSGLFSYYTMNTGMPDNKITSITQDKRGHMWFGTPGSGLCGFDGTSFTTITTLDGLSHNNVTSVTTDRNGNLWVGTWAGGITNIVQDGNGDQEKLHFIQYTVKEGILRNSITTVYIDKQNNIWIGSLMGGVSRFQPSADGLSGLITNYTEREGIQFRNIFCITEDQKGNIWLGAGAGVVRMDVPGNDTADTITYYGKRKKDIIINNSRSLFQDQSGKIWIGTHKGLRVIAGHEDPQKQVQDISFFRFDGLKGDEFLSNSVLFDRNNRAWWGSRKGGVEMLDLNAFKIPQTTPQPRLQRLDINESFLDFRNLTDSLHRGIRFDSVSAFENYPNNLTLTHRKNHLTFYFSNIDWGVPHKTRYSFRMKGLDEEWSQLTSETKAEYRGLHAGTYTFSVRAFGESNQWSEPYDYTFTILPPWWLSWWAYVIYSLIGISIVYQVYLFQLKRRLDVEEKRRLIQLDQLKNKLYTNITHEFRTPLTLIHGPLSQALSSHASLDEKDMKSMYKQSKRLQQLITQILDLQKVESGKLKPQYIYGEVVSFIRYLFDAFASLAKEKGVTMEYAAAPQEIMMDYDEEKLTQIVSNLISNAIRHTPGNGRVSLTLNTSPYGDALLIRIQDTGVGISGDELPFIFDRYYQSSRAAQGGTGVGLALAKSLVELLRGNITVVSALDAGTTFKVMLPITTTAQKTIAQTKEVKEVIHDSYDDEERFSAPANVISDKPIILIVEDHPEVSQFIAACLARDYTTMKAFDGEEGIRMAIEHIPDMIISDVVMPRKDGFELCATLKSDIHTSHIPIILLTGRGDQAALMEGIEHGADAYVVKPFEPQELLLRVKKLLELRASLSQYYRTPVTTTSPDSVVHASAKENAFLQSLRIFIEEHMNDPQFNMNMLCKHMAISHPQLHRKITALTGESTGKFVRSVRLTKAIALLQHSDLTVSEIAYETGFTEPGYFTKVFSKEYHMSPTEYRASLA